ncbi:hypothetical protein ACI784_15250 [Geodermatophilus sp. SYSU D01186]
MYLPTGRFMKHRALVMATAAAVMALSACGGVESAATTKARLTLPPTTSAAPTTTAPAPPTPERNARGNLVKGLGEAGGFGHPDTGEDMVSWAVDEIVVDLPCTEPYYDYEPENGHIVGLRLRVSTGSDLSPLGYFAVDEQDFSYIGPDGITRSNIYSVSAYACLPSSEQFTTDELGPSQQYVGTVVLDVPGTTGTIVYKPSAAEGGWEWNF